MKQHFSTGGYRWCATAYPGAREAVVTLQPVTPSARIPSGKPSDPERCEREATRRASTKCRRLCVANGLDRLWTLTYALEPDDERQILDDVARFMRKCRARRKNWKYLYVIERGSKSGRLHVHFATNEFVPKPFIAAAWTHGFVDARRISRRGSGDPRAAARYLSKYVSKSGDDQQRQRSRRRFVPGLSLVLDAVKSVHVDLAAAERWCQTLMPGGKPPVHVWCSAQQEDWKGPPCNVAFF